MTTYVAIGYESVGGAHRPFLVSGDRKRLEAHLARIRVVGDPTSVRHDGTVYHRVEVLAVETLDGPQVVVAGTVGTINM